MKFAEHLFCQTPPDARFRHKKIVYTVFKDYMIISTYQLNSQLILTSSMLTKETVEKEAKCVQS